MWSHREFKIAIRKKLNMLQENRKTVQWTKEKINEKKEYFIQETETLNQTEVMKLKNSINDMKNGIKKQWK